MGVETDHAEISAWAHEVRAWMALTTGDYHGVVVAAQHGLEAAPHHGVAVQAGRAGSQGVGSSR
jgi:hypothetical protein